MERLTPEKITKLFLSLDSNKDGKLTADEISAGLKSLRLPSSTKEIEQLLKAHAVLVIWTFKCD